MDGVLGADENCQALANAAELPGIYMAWISGTLEPVTDRIDMSGGPFVRPDGALVAVDWADLTDGTLEHAISIDETGVDRSGGAVLQVWTSTHHDGSRNTTQPTGTCKSWTSPEDPDAGLGNLTRTDSAWSFSETGACQSSARLYCIGTPI